MIKMVSTISIQAGKNGKNLKYSSIIIGIVLMGLFSCQHDGKQASDGDSGFVENPAGLVNPFIDTHSSRWFYFSSATRPFGMVNLSPDTDTESTWKSGYLYDSKHIRCFSHVHGWQLAGIPVLPTTGEMKGHLGMDEYQSTFSHDNEIAKPGYHKVTLDDYEVTAELTSTLRNGFHRYTFHNQKERYILFDVGARLAHSPTADTYVEKVNNSGMQGYMLLSETPFRKKPLKVYFYAEFNTPFKEFGTWKNKQLIEGDQESIEGKNTGAFVRYPGDVDEVLLKVAISYTSMQNARFNMQHELDHWDFERVKKESFDEWNQWLSKIKIKGGTRQQQVKFYTDLWHALQGRRIMSDANGYYIDNTGTKPKVRRVKMKNGTPVFNHYNFDGLWGSHWTINILWSMVYPELMDALCNTMVDMYKNGGYIPRGPSGGTYTYIMTGDPSTSFFATAYNKGIRNYDIDLAYEGLYKNAFEEGLRDSGVWRPGHKGSMKYYLERGYVPEGVPEGVNRGGTLTLEYAYYDWCLAQIAKPLGKEEDYKMFMERAYNYKNLWNPETRLMHPREKDGSWIKDFHPVKEVRHGTKGFVEANSAVYTHFVPHDIAGLAKLFGGYDAYNDFLNGSFEKAKTHGFVEVTKDIRASHWVNYANEPGHGMGHIFNHSGAPWLSQKWIRAVKKALNDTTPYGGYNGDEDQGKAGALGVLMAIGLFEEDGGAFHKPFYEITSPIFDEILITLNQNYYPGESFRILCENNSDENMYIQSAELNGKPIHNCWFYHDKFADGGTLKLKLGPAPNKEWGVAELPPSMSRLKHEK